MGPRQPQPCALTSEDLLEAFDEEPFLHWLMCWGAPIQAAADGITFDIKDGPGTVGVDQLARISARAAYRPAPSVGPASPDRFLIRNSLALQIRKEVVQRAFDQVMTGCRLNSIPGSVSSSPATGVLSGVDRGKTPAYRNHVVHTTGDFSDATVLTVRSALQKCSGSAKERGMHLIVSSPETFDSLCHTLDSRELTYLCEFKDGRESHAALAFGGACWIPVWSYNDPGSCRILTLDDVALHIGTTRTSSGLILPGESASCQYSVATAMIQITFPRLSTHAAVGGWVPK